MQNNIKREFQALNNGVFLNTPSCGLIATSVLKWRKNFDKQRTIFPDNYLIEHQNIIQDVKNCLAQNYNASANEIALIPNFSFGLNMVLESLDKQEKILLLKGDYPSVEWPVEERGFNFDFVDITENLEDNIRSKIETFQPTVFIFSIVQWLNGIKIDLDYILQLKKDNPSILFIADGTQYLGMEDFNFEASGIDILAASGYKWLNAGFGNGFLIIKASVKKKLNIKTIGFNSSVNFKDKPNESSFIRLFEPGHQDALNYGSIKAAIDFTKEIGQEKCFKRTAHLAKQAKIYFSKNGWIEEMVSRREIHSSIFNVKGNHKLFEKLQKNNFSCAMRGKGIRVGFHYYNDENDLDCLIEILK